MQNDIGESVELNNLNVDEKCKNLLELITDLQDKIIKQKFETELSNSNLLINFDPNSKIKIDEMEKKLNEFLNN